MKNFYILYGEDKSIIENELNILLKKENKQDIIKYSLDNTKIEDIIEDASMISMFSNKKIILIENSNFLGASKSLDNIEILENYINNYNPNTYIIFIANIEKVDTRKKIYKLINKTGTIIECNKKDNTYIINFINNYLKENKYKLNDINYFLNIVGTNLDNIKNELDKLFMYKIEDKTINNEDINKICLKNIEEEVFVLTDSIIAKDKNKALNLLKDFLNKNYEEITLLIMLANQFRFLFQVKRLENKSINYNEIAKILEVNPYRVKYTERKIYNYSEKEITDKIKELAKYDHDIKLGLIDKKLALELFILNY
ncbi:MAG: DNA polymerase III subunit delta [Bacilli bacterium]|nr:DNA polymerase III subunit delta [Bacilli bacterium]